MPNKSALHVTIDNGSGVSIVIQDDSTGFLILSMTDGVTTLVVKMTADNLSQLNRTIMASNLLRTQAPQS